MDGIFVNGDRSGITLGLDNTNLTLLAKHAGLEVMAQTVPAKSTVWIEPAVDRDTIEFFYVLSGSLDLVLENGARTVDAGGSFYVDGLAKEVYLHTASGTELLYITNKPLFDDVFGYQGNLNELMRLVDAKDNYTYNHCYRVMRYSVMLSRAMKRGDISSDDLVAASLFHDVGKCFIPDEVLNKPGPLSDNEFRQIMKHPVDSARLLMPKFGKKVAEIARSHHERLDGSGYPYGLCGDEITLESRIIAVADSFDAMTTKRCYTSKVMSFEQASAELASLPRKYDRKVTSLLLRLVQSGELTQGGDAT